MDKRRMFYFKLTTDMKKLTTLATLFLLVFSISSCAQSYRHRFSTGNSWLGGKEVKASKNYVTKEIKVKDFDRIQVEGSLDVTYKQQTGKPEVEIYTSDNIVDLLDIYVKGGTLYLNFKKNVSVAYNKLEIRVCSNRLGYASVTGSGSLDLANALNTDNLELKVTGSGDITGGDISCTEGFTASVTGSGDFKCKQLTTRMLNVGVTGSGDLNVENASATSVVANVAGSGTLKIKGKAEEAEYSVAGSGDLLASDFEVQRVSAAVAGSGDIKCHAVKFLKARTNGSGDIGYKGNPELDYPKKGLYKL